MIHMQLNRFGWRAVLALSMFAVSGAPELRAAELTESDKFFLAGYEEIRVALVADDLVAANDAARRLTDSGIEVPRSETLERARDGFVKTSAIAVKVASGHTGYYVMRCPKLKRDWVQTSKDVGNPYGGKSMVTCGQIKR
jgi:hypothetical protein